MRNWRMVGVGAFAFCAILTSCDRKTEVGEQPKAGTQPSSADDVTLIVHMTGALLMVPGGTGATTVLLPKDRLQMGHLARLGFGIAKDNPEGYPCVDDPVFSTPPTSVGICYINLDNWEVTIGIGGQPNPPGQVFPDGVLNVTLLSKGHTAPTSGAGANYRARVLLAAGRPGPEHCSLASWTYEWEDEQGTLHTDTRALTNVLRWHIQNPTPVLRLQSTTNSADVRTVALPPAEQDTIELVLAHVPVNDLAHLPPGIPPPTPSGETKLAAHFDLYYDLLRHAGGGQPQRRIPHDATPTGTLSCPVAITSPVPPFIEPSSVATYACMVAWGEG
ncbi:MAG TPA: hypothetical protein VFT45_25540 [Longimicrobium sp.]|nr:hypothetical protein [Longimicrobium sp.]